MVFIWLERQSLGQGFRVRVQVFTDLEASMRLCLSGLSWEILPKILALFQCAGMSGKHHNGAEGGGSVLTRFHKSKTACIIYIMCHVFMHCPRVLMLPCCLPSGFWCLAMVLLP